jgi:hypothetical protein
VATPAWRRFRALVLEDEELERRLVGIDGWEAFRSEALLLAQQVDVALDGADLEEARLASRASWQARWNSA